MIRHYDHVKRNESSKVYIFFAYHLTPERNASNIMETIYFYIIKTWKASIRYKVATLENSFIFIFHCNVTSILKASLKGEQFGQKSPDGEKPRLCHDEAETGTKKGKRPAHQLSCQSKIKTFTR